jgi:hypothetical protein
MRKYSQKELLSEVFFDLIKKTGKAMNVIDPKASENLQRPFKQVRGVYRSFAPETKEYATSKSVEYVPGSTTAAKKFTQKNPKIIQKIASTEKDIYNRELDPTNITTINMKLPDGKAIQNLIVISKSLQDPNKPPQRYMYDKFGRFIKKL